MEWQSADPQEAALRALLADEKTRAFLLALYREASLGRLVGGAVHQLRNHLNAILNGTQLLAERAGDQALAAKLLPVMLRSSQHMGESLETLDQHSTEHQVELRAVVAQCLRGLRDRTLNVALHIEEGAPVWLRARLDEVHPMVSSVLQSHVSCTPEQLRVTVAADASLAQLSVEHSQGLRLLEDAGLEFLLQTSLATSLDGSLTRSVAHGRSTLCLPVGAS